MPKQIGWSNESNLLYQISQQITRLINVTGTNGGGGGSITGSGTTGYIPKWTSSSAIGNSLIYDTGTRIGIGTTTPAQTLDVSGNIRGQYIIADAALYGSQLRVDGIYSNSLTYIPFYSNVTPFGEIMRITNNGNVLIGTTTDSGNKLQVSGTSAFISSSTAGQSIILGNVNFNWNFNTSIAPQVLSLAYGANNVLNIGYDAPDDLIKIYNGGNIQFSTNYFTVGGDANTPITSARMNIESTTKGSLPLPRMTTAQIKAITSPVNGLMAYSTNEFAPCFYDSNAGRWEKLNHSTL